MQIEVTPEEFDRIRKLLRKQPKVIPEIVDLASKQMDPTLGCPCRPENGGSGICGCILGGAKITC